MSSNNSISQIMLNKLEQREDYLAWYLSQYKKNESLNDEEVAKFLESENDISRLGMCKAPNSKVPDFIERIKSIAEFASVNSFKLSAIIRKVDSVIALQNISSSINTSLMAAREKDDESKDNKE